ncbi:hypothetical protein DFH27DRAFT_603543 [Peziza echinospora]|nr:hypothetical protein DFH27DRAFT_603543 [Peziza echinospora]
MHGTLAALAAFGVSPRGERHLSLAAGDSVVASSHMAWALETGAFVSYGSRVNHPAQEEGRDGDVSWGGLQLDVEGEWRMEAEGCGIAVKRTMRLSSSLYRFWAQVYNISLPLQAHHSHFPTPDIPPTPPPVLAPHTVAHTITCPSIMDRF